MTKIKHQFIAAITWVLLTQQSKRANAQLADAYAKLKIVPSTIKIIDINKAHKLSIAF